MKNIIVEDLVDDLMVAIMVMKRIRMRLEVIVRTKGEIILIISIIRTIVIKVEELEDKDLYKEASMGNIFIAEKGIENFNVPNAKEG